MKQDLEQDFYSRKELVEVRGWGKRTVKRLLPGTMKPDGYRPAGTPGLLPIPVFHHDRIVAMEQEHKLEGKQADDAPEPIPAQLKDSRNRD